MPSWSTTSHLRLPGCPAEVIWNVLAFRLFGWTLPSIKPDVRRLRWRGSNERDARAEACARRRPAPPADACGFSGDIWAPAQMWWWWWGHSSRQVWVGPSFWTQPGQQTNHVCLANPYPTAPAHIRTQEQTGAGMLTRRTPGEETCLTQSCVCLLPSCFEMSVFPSEALRDWSHV